MKRIIIILTSLFACTLFQASDIFKAIESKNNKEIRLWLKNNPDMTCLNDHGQTVLIKAVQSRNYNLVHKLLQRGVTVNSIDNFGKTALDYAVEMQNKSIIKILVKTKASVTTEENAQKCKQLIMTSKGLVARIFLALGIGTIGLVFVAALACTLAVYVFYVGIAAISGISVSWTPLFLGPVVAMGTLGAATYGAVKVGTKEKDLYLVETIKPIA